MGHSAVIMPNIRFHHDIGREEEVRNDMMRFLFSSGTFGGGRPFLVGSTGDQNHERCD